MIEVLKVSSHSNPNAVAGALAGVVRSSGVVEIQVVGAGALNQAVKAVAIARGYLTPSGVDLVCIPTFADIQIEGERRTAIRLLCENRAVAPPTVDLRTAEVSRAQRRASEPDLPDLPQSSARSTHPAEGQSRADAIDSSARQRASATEPLASTAGTLASASGPRASGAEPVGSAAEPTVSVTEPLVSPAESPAQSL
jgi:stage V sporulation protein S